MQITHELNFMHFFPAVCFATFARFHSIQFHSKNYRFCVHFNAKYLGPVLEANFPNFNGFFLFSVFFPLLPGPIQQVKICMAEICV